MGAVREYHIYLPMSDADVCYRIDTNERAAVVVAVVVGTLHERTLRMKVAQSHVYPNGGIEVGKDGPAACSILKQFRILHIH